MAEVLPQEYDYKIIENTEKILIFRIKNVCDKDSALAWLYAYEAKSKLTWRKLRTFPNTGKINLFREEYRCHHNTDDRYRGLNKRISKHTGCEATLKIIVKRHLENSKSKFPDPDSKEYPCIITIANKHNHCLQSAAVLRFRDMAEETEKKLLCYFQQGYSASHARHSLEMDLLLNDEENYEVAKSDAAILPSSSVIQHLFNREFTDAYGARHGSAMEDDLELFLKNKCNLTGSKASFQNNEGQFVIALCTPIMQRAVELLPQSNEIIFVDASSNMDKDNHRIFFFITSCVVGGVPLGCIITNNEKEATFRAGVKLLISCLPQDSRLVKSGPVVFMTDGDLKEKKVLSEFWENSRFLLCQFHVLKAVWAWLFEKKNDVSKDTRREIYFLFKDLMNSPTVEILNEKWMKMEKNPLLASEKIRNYFSGLWNKKELWASCYRLGLPIRGNNTNNYIEALFRVLKECILDRVKALSVIQLTDFILTGYENYLRNRLLDFSFSRYSKNLLRKFNAKSCTENIENIIYDEKNDIYIIPGKNNEWEVDLSGIFCTCPKGNTGQLCKHISAVIMKYSVELPAYVNSVQSRDLIYRIAMGKKPDNDEFLQELSFNPISKTSSHIANTAILPVKNPISSNRDVVAVQDCNNSDDDNLNPESTKQKLILFHEKLASNINDNPNAFVPAVNKMIENADKFIKTENAMLSALHNFAKPTHNLNTTINVKRKRSGVQIPVQPTAIGRRKTSLTGKRSHLGGRPSNVNIIKNIKEHDYTPFSHLPDKRKKAKHDINDCVLKNISVGRDRAFK